MRANETGATVDLFAPGAVTPGAQIGGANTGLVEPVSVALDAAFNVYVFDFATQNDQRVRGGSDRQRCTDSHDFRA
jgi:hypothetical protein